MSTAATIQTEIQRLEVRPLAANITSVQPGGGVVARLERAWGRLRRGSLKTCRPGYVAWMQARRKGECPNCPYNIADSRDPKLYRNVCGFHFGPEDDRCGWRGRLIGARMGLAESCVVSGSRAVATAA